MIPVVTWGVGDNQPLEPFDASSTNLSWNDSSRGRPWSGLNDSPFILWASIMPLFLSITQFNFRDVP